MLATSYLPLNALGTVGTEEGRQAVSGEAVTRLGLAEVEEEAIREGAEDSGVVFVGEAEEVPIRMIPWRFLFFHGISLFSIV